MAEVEHVTERAGDLAGAARCDESAAPASLFHLNDARDLETADSFAQRRAADVEHLGQFAFGRQAVAGLQFAADQLRADRIADLLEDSASLDGTERFFASAGLLAIIGR